MRVEEAPHGQGGGEGRGLREILVLPQGEQGFVEGAVRHEDGGVRAGVGPKGKDAGNGGLRSRKDRVVCHFEAALNESAI